METRQATAKKIRAFYKARKLRCSIRYGWVVFYRGIEHTKWLTGGNVTRYKWHDDIKAVIYH
jgi:hypothetical protein